MTLNKTLVDEVIRLTKKYFEIKWYRLFIHL